jgi:hypothetical protein
LCGVDSAPIFSATYLGGWITIPLKLSGIRAINYSLLPGEHFLCVFWPFEFLLLKKFYLVQLPISELLL